MALISDSLSVSQGWPARGSGAGAAGGPSAQSPGLAVRFLWRRGPAPRQALCSSARLGRLPGPTCLQLEARLALFFLFKGEGEQPAMPSARAPLPPRLRGSRHLDPRRAVPGLKEQPRVPSGRSPPPASPHPPAGWPLSHRFHRSRLRFPAPSPSLPSLVLGRIQLARTPRPGAAQGAPPPC